MILADKIIRLRKKNGWSQEELAEKMNVSRQAVSKWEAAQTTPDLEKILMLGNLFGVTTDYLLKDEIEDEEFAEDSPDAVSRSVTLEEANAYIAHCKWASEKIALATFLCILSPSALIVLSVISANPKIGITVNAASLLGLIILVLLVAVAVAIFVYVDAKNSPYKYLDTDPFELAYGVSGMVKERQKKFHSSYVKGNIVGICLCILAPVILLVGAFTENAVATVFTLSAMFVVVGIGVWQLISVGVRWSGLERLLCEGEFTAKGKKKSKITEAVGSVFWLFVTAVYLGWSFWTDKWNITWMVWPIAGVLYAAVTVIVNALVDKKDQ